MADTALQHAQCDTACAQQGAEERQEAEARIVGLKRVVQEARCRLPNQAPLRHIKLHKLLHKHEKPLSRCAEHSSMRPEWRWPQVRLTFSTISSTKSSAAWGLSSDMKSTMARKSSCAAALHSSVSFVGIGLTLSFDDRWSVGYDLLMRHTRTRVCSTGFELLTQPVSMR